MGFSPRAPRLRVNRSFRRSMPWVGEGLDGVGMYFDEIRFLQALFDVRPHLDERFFKHCAPQIASSNPNDFGRRPLDNDAVEEISVPR